jgi:MYXO-CTERM domain-containing protein
MKRLTLLGSWRRLGIQSGLLVGLGLAFVGSPEPPAKADQCLAEGDCTFRKPNFMIVMDYSASMNLEYMGGQTRWEAAVEAVQNLVTANNGYFDDHLHMALMRFCHDPDPNSPGTTIPGDTSGLVDGVKLDVHWYDPVNAPEDYFECNGDAIVQELAAMDPPIGGAAGGCGTWTNGAMVYTQQLIEETRAHHPEDTDPATERLYANLLLTDGVWCSYEWNPITNQVTQSCADANPALIGTSWDPGVTIGHMYQNMDVPTYVVAIGEAVGTQLNHDLAIAGGTGQALEPGLGQLIPALESVVEDIVDGVITPSCIGGMPRIMIVLDASSSMLNVGGTYGAQGQTGWDQAFDALTGVNGMFMVEVDLGGAQTPWGTTPKVQDLVHMGTIVFGSQGEEDVLVDYGPCMRDNLQWALDPWTSCGAGCNDPWDGPPIDWTFLSSPPEIGPHGFPFDQETHSHMPACMVQNTPQLCTGSATYTHLGLELAASNAEAYRNNPPDIYPLGATTPFINILITDGAYTGWSSHAEVQNALVGMHGNDDTVTYVIGFGELAPAAELENMACWGSGGAGNYPNCQGGAHPHFTANNQQDLEDALKMILESIDFDPCCALNDCEFNPEPSTGQPDPVPPPLTGTDSDSGDDMGDTGDDSGDDTGADDRSDDAADDGLDDGTDTDGPGDGDGDGGSQSGDGDGGSQSGDGSASADDTATATATATVTAGDTDAPSDTDGDSAGVGRLDDDGCACTTAPSRGAPGALLLLGLGALVRKRRR